MKLNISTSSVQPMRTALRKLHNGKLSRGEMDRVLTNRDYAVEFTYYAQPDFPVCNIKKLEFLDYIMSCQKLSEEEIPNDRLCYRHEDFMWLLSKIDSLNDSVFSMFDIKAGDLARIEQILTMCLPDDIIAKAGEITLLFTIGVGNVNVWVEGQYIHFDVIGLLKSVHDKESLLIYVTHQLIHLFMSNMFDEMVSLSPLEEFLLSFSYEGVAVKFANNAAGILSHPVRSGKSVNALIDKKSWEHHTREFPLALNRLKSDIQQIKYTNPSYSEVGARVQEFWIRPDITSLCDEKDIYVNTYRNYFMGSEIFGAIYDCFGKERLVSVLRHPIDIIPAFNEAVKTAGHEEFAIL